MKIHYKRSELIFKRPAGTSRGIYNSRPVWYLFLEEDGKTGIGECAPLPGLSLETTDQIEYILNKISESPELVTGGTENKIHELTANTPSVRFALEAALADLAHGGKQELFPTAFTASKQGIPVNGLIWMGDVKYMEEQIREKIDAGFRCIKMKVGALDFKSEIKLLELIREIACGSAVAIRLDANGAFRPEEALRKLELLSVLDIQVIEQPIAPGNSKQMAALCDETPIPVALDEELIGVNSRSEKERLLDTIRPQFLTLKPSLHGGISGCDEWIDLAAQRSIGWWATSYLESNIGLNAIAQWVSSKETTMHQGLGTGQLFTNNVPSPLEMRGECLWRNASPDLPVVLPPSVRNR